MATKSIYIFVWLLVATAAPAVPVDIDHPSGFVSVIWAGPYRATVLTDAGLVYEVELAEGGGDISCTQRPELSPPIPVSDIRDWNGSTFVTQDAAIWQYQETNPGGPGEWETGAIECVGPVDSNINRLEDLKAKFR